VLLGAKRLWILCLQLSPGGSTITAMRHASLPLSKTVTIAWQFQTCRQALHQ